MHVKEAKGTWVKVNRVFLRLKKGQGPENKKRALLIFLRAHF